MPTPRFMSQVAVVPSAAAATSGTSRGLPGGRVTVETVETVVFRAEGGPYWIRGVPTPTRVPMNLLAGDSVSVLWRGDTPFMILDLQSQKGPGTDEPESAGGVEELIQAPPSAPEGIVFPDTDIWFRNSRQVTLLNVRRLLGVPSVAFGVSRGWGAQKRHFLLADTKAPVVPAGGGHAKFYVVALAGDPKHAIRGRPRARLEAQVDAGVSEIVLGAVSVRSTRSGGEFGPLTTVIKLGEALTTGYRVMFQPPDFGAPTAIEDISCYVTDAYLNKKNEIIATAQVAIEVFPTTIGIQHPFWNYPVIVNLTLGTVIFNGLTSPLLLPQPGDPVRDGLDYDVSLDVLTHADVSSNLFIFPLADETGAVARALVAATYPKDPESGIGDCLFASYIYDLRRGGVDLELVALRTSGTGGDNHDCVWVVGENQRYVLWTRATVASALGHGVGLLTFTPGLSGVTFDHVHMADFNPPKVNGVQVLEDAVAADDALALFSFDPVLVSPSLLYLVNSTPANLAATDVRNVFARFKSGTTLVIDQPPKEVPGSKGLASLKPYAGASKFIKSFLAAFVEDPTRPDVNLSSLTTVLKYQMIVGDGSNVPKN